MIKKRALAALLGVGVAGALAACAPVASGGSTADDSSASPGDTSLTVFISGDTNLQDLWEKGIVPAYQKEHPDVSVDVTIDLHGEHDQQTIAKLTASTEAGDDPGYDIVDAGFVISSAAEADLLLKVDDKTVTGLSDVPEDTVTAGKGYGIPYRASSVLLAYDTTKITDPPTTLDELLQWIQDNPGQFAYNSPSTGGSGSSFVSTVLDSYLTQEEQDTLRTKKDETIEAKWDEGFQKLKDLGPSMYQGGVYPNGNSQVLDLLGNGSISMAPVWSDQFITAVNNGLIPDTVAYTQISDPSFTGSASYLGIPKTSENTDAAIDLVDFVLSAEGQEIIADQIAGYPVVSLDSLSADLQEKFADADPSALRPGYYSDVSSDMNNLWDQRVP